ncbi:MAG: carboxypeptidase regulatory-like domain-containing protein [Gemmatimonadaceae bacterium]|nr:carboxypeptidase regulatory-like domain-containing protein [Gemmatimonadaceae bacterium]
MGRAAPLPRTSVALAAVMVMTAASCAAGLSAQQRPAVRSAASVAGTVIDSIAGRGLDGATVQLLPGDSVEGTARTVESDSLGRFRFAGVPPGRYRLGFVHPALDDLGIEATPVSVVVARGVVRRADLAIPSPATLRLALCGDDAIRDSIALVIGHVRRARDGAPLDSVIVAIQWQQRVRETGSGATPAQQRRVAASSVGWFVACAARGGDTILFTASRGGAATTRQTLLIPPSGLLRHVALLSDVPATTPLTAPTVAGAAASTTPAARGQQPPSTFPVSGVVVNSDGGLPVAGVIIAIPGGASTRSDSRGVWRLDAVTGGTQTLTVRAVRYAPLRVTVPVSPGMPPVRLAMVRLPRLLDTVNVVGDAEKDQNLADFLERSRTRGSGTFLSDVDITSRRPTLTSDLFLSVQGGITIERDTLGNRYITMRSNTFRTIRCLPSIFVDGMSMRGLTAADIDGLVRPSELFGVEIYRAANAPVEFSEQDGCGTILLWTKR